MIFAPKTMLDDSAQLLSEAGWKVFKIDSQRFPVVAICFRKDRTLLLSIKTSAHDKMLSAFIVIMATMAGPHLSLICIKTIDDLLPILTERDK